MKYHLIAIGGTGMGALAGLLKAKGHQVRGSDVGVYPPMSEQLQALEIPVYEGFGRDNLAWGPDRVIVGNVCSKDHVEVLAAQEASLELQSFPQVLAGEFLSDRNSVVVAGTHGKTTTSSLIAHTLFEAGRDPGFFIGGVPENFGRGWRLGAGPEMVVEGDEYDSAFFDKGSKFLHYSPKVATLSSVELDHVDIFTDMQAVRDTYKKFVALLPPDGLLVVNGASEEAVKIASECASCRVEYYLVEGDEAAPIGQKPTWEAKNILYTESARRTQFDLYRSGERFGRFECILTGSYNVGNACACIAVAHECGVTLEEIETAISSFAGIARRQQVRGLAQGVYVVDDYGHHPTAIGQTILGLQRRFPERRIVAAYEPRSATSRRSVFQTEFVTAFQNADFVIVGPLFDPTNIPDEDRFDADKLVADLRQVKVHAAHLEDNNEIVERVCEYVRPGDVVVIFSSGKFGGLHEQLLAALGDAMVPARREDMTEVLELLKSLELDFEDLSEDDHKSFLLLRNETGLVGCVALEVFGEDAVLRSLSVKAKHRGVGYGWMLADAVMGRARRRGVRRVYLATAEATDFFAQKLGFHEVDPATIPTRVANSATMKVRASRGQTAMRIDVKI